MKKSKIVSLVMAVTTVFSTVTPVLATDVVTSNYDYSVMPISEVYEEPPLLISPKPVSQEIKVLLNNEEIDFTDENGNKVTPKLINSRTMVPMRKIFEVFDATIEWDGATETITATTEDKVLKLQINNEIATVMTEDETEEMKLDSVPVVVDGRTLVPVRFISETLGLKVGWDATSQTVIIIDPSFVLDIVKDEAPTFYELITTDFTIPKTSETKFTMDSNLKYTNAEEKSNNSNIKLAMTGNTKMNEDAMEMNVDYKITGKGIIYEQAKEEGTDKVTLSAILDMKNFAYYIKSSMLEEEIGNKWLKEVFASAEEIETMIDIDTLKTPEKVELENLISTIFDYVDINKDTYQTAELLTKIMCKFVSDDLLTVSGRTTKTYTYEISAKEINEIFEGIGVGVVLPSEIVKEAKLKFTMKIKDNMNTDATLALNGTIKADAETIELDATTKATLVSANKTITIKLPAEKDVYEIDYDSMANETVSNAQLAGFMNDVSEVQQAFQIACTSKYGNMKAEGSNVNYKQTYNYMARGGEYANAEFVSFQEANAIKCTKINENYAREVLGFDLPKTLAKDENNNEVQASYYATSEGNIFVWPPFEGKDGYYVSYRDMLDITSTSEIFENGYKFMVGNVEIEVGKDIK